MWRQLVVLLVLTAAVWDLREHKIPNGLTLAGILGGLILHFYTAGWQGLFFSLQGAVAGLLFLFFPFAWGGMGAGDVKLLTAIGALGGVGFAATVALAMGIVGGIMAAAIMFWQGALGSIVKRLLYDGYRVFLGLPPAGKSSGLAFPYGVAIALGACITLMVW